MRTICGAVTANHQTPAGTPPAAGPATGAAVAPAGDPLTGGGADVVVVPDEIRERIAALENDRADASEAEDRGEPVDIVEEVAGLLPDQP